MRFIQALSTNLMILQGCKQSSHVNNTHYFEIFRFIFLEPQFHM